MNPWYKKVMGLSSKGFIRTFANWFRRVFARPAREMARAGKIAQVLYDVSQLQEEQRKQYRQIGEVTLKLVEQGALKNLRVEQLSSKVKRTQRLLQRQERLLRSYQDRSDISRALKVDDLLHQKDLEPV